MDQKQPIRADSLRFALAFALRDVRLDRHRLGLPEDARYRIADEVVAYLRRDGRWPELNETGTPRPLSDGSQAKWHR